MTACPTDAQDEIEKIMSEIENLQEVMNDTVDVPSPEQEGVAEPEGHSEDSAEAEESMAEFRGTESDVLMEETLNEIQDEEPAPAGGILASIAPSSTASEESPEEKPVRLAYERVSAPDVSHPAGEGGSLSLRLTGSMTLTLEYEYEGEFVTVGFAENMLKVQLSDGTEFKIPVRREAKLRKVA